MDCKLTEWYNSNYRINWKKSPSERFVISQTTQRSVFSSVLFNILIYDMEENMNHCWYSFQMALTLADREIIISRSQSYRMICVAWYSGSTQMEIFYKEELRAYGNIYGAAKVHTKATETLWGHE